MADAYKGLTVRLGVDTTSLSSGLRKVRSEMSGVTTDLKRIERALKIDPGNTKLLAQQQADYRAAIKSTERQLELLRQAEEQLENTQGPMTPEQQAQWTRLQSEIVMTEQRLQGYRQALLDSVVQQNAAESSLGRLGNALTSNAEKFNAAGRAMQTVGRGLTTGVTVPVIAAGAATIKAATDIDSSLTSVKKTVDGTAEQYEELKQKAVEFSQTNAVSASQILDIQALGAQLGFAIDELDEFSRVVSGLDIATNMDAETAATEMAQFANITKMAHGEVSNYGSAIVGLGNSFATTESDISSMAMRLAAAGTQVGMSQADILGLATALSSMGVEAEAGGTAISTIMSQIDKDIATCSDSVETWASAAGMSAQQFADAWKGDPVQALSALFSGMEAATEEGGNMSVMLEELGIDAVRQTDVMKRLAGNSEFVAKAVATANEEWSANTALSKEVENRNESLAAKFQILKNRVVAVADDIGGELADALLEAIDAAEPLIEAIEDGAKAFSEMDDEQQRVVLTAVALAAALGPVLNVSGKMLTMAEGIGKACKSLAEKIATAKLAFSGLSAQAKGATASLEAQTAATKAASAAMTAAKAAAGTLAVALAAILVAKMVEDWQRYSDRLKTAKGATDGVREAISAMNGEVKASSPAVEAASSSLADYTQAAYDAMQQQADLASSMKESWEEIGAQKSILSDAMSVIEQYAGQSGLTAEQQAELYAAVSNVNDVCGTNYSVIDAANGILSESTDAIRANTDAWIANAEAQAAQEQLVELKKQQITLEQQQSEIMDEISSKTERLNELNSKSTRLTNEETIERARLSNEIAEAKNAYDDLGKSIDSNARSQDALVGKVSESQQALQSTTSAIAECINGNEALSSAVQAAGVDVESLSAKLSELGFSTSDLAGLTSEQMAALVSCYDGSAADIIAVCDQLGISVPEKMRQSVEGAASAVSDATPQVTGSVIQMKDGVVYALEPMTGQFVAIGASAASGLASSVAAGAPSAGSAGGSLKDSAVSGANPMIASLGSIGTSGGKGLATSLSATSGQARNASSSVASAAEGPMSSVSASTWTYGNHAGNNFASGISAAVGAAMSAASNLAQSVKNILGHTVPKEGPLRNGGKGEKEWGQHTVQNYIDGIRSQLPELRKASEEVASVTSMGFVAPGGGNIGLQMPNRAAGSYASIVNSSSTRTEVHNHYTVGSVSLTEGTTEAAAVRAVVEYAARARAAYES